MREFFEKFSRILKSAYIEWIEEAKKQETRENPMKKAFAMIAENDDV